MGLSDKHTICQGSSQRGKESTCQHNAHALPNDTTGGQEARCTALLIFRGGPHQSAIVGRLKEGLSQAYHHQTPDDSEENTLCIRLADGYHSDAGYGQTAGCQPARTDAVGQRTR